MPVSPTTALVAEVEYYNQLILDQFGKLEVLSPHTPVAGVGSSSVDKTAIITIDSAEHYAATVKREKAIKRLHKAIDQLRTECEKLAITGVSAETAAAQMDRKSRFGLPSPSPTSSNGEAIRKTPNSKGVDGSEDPATIRAEKWRWTAYCHELDALFTSKYPGQRVTDATWELSLVASTLRSRMHALLFELIPLERVADGGKIRRGNISPSNTPSASASTATALPPTHSTSERHAADESIIRILTTNVQDALEQLRSTCRDAITIKETSVLEARLKASNAAATIQSPLLMGGSVNTSASSPGGAMGTPSLQSASYFHSLHTAGALSPFELLIVQFMSAEAIRIAGCYGITMAGGNSCSGASNAAMGRRGSYVSLGGSDVHTPATIAVPNNHAQENGGSSAFNNTGSSFPPVSPSTPSVSVALSSESPATIGNDAPAVPAPESAQSAPSAAGAGKRACAIM